MHTYIEFGQAETAKYSEIEALTRRKDLVDGRSSNGWTGMTTSINGAGEEVLEETRYNVGSYGL